MINSISSIAKRFSTFQLNDKAVPLILLFVTVVSFGLLTPFLGFFWDDWPVIYLTHTQGISGFWAFYQYDRPFSAWTYILLTPILGTAPLAWYALVLGLRWLTSIFVWLVSKILWPAKHHQALWISILFAVCPVFLQQQIAVAYSQHWICYLFYLMSLYFMLRANEDNRRYWQFTMVALTLAFVHLFTMEYFVGLELLRPFVLWVYKRSRDRQASKREAFGFALKNSWIYLGALVIYLVWRFVFPNPLMGDVNNPVLLSGFLDNPLRAVIPLLERVLQDFLYLLSYWIVSVNPVDIELWRPFSLIVLVIIFFVAGVLVAILKRYRPLELDEKYDRWALRAILFGTVAVLLGLAPVWIVGRHVVSGGNRFSFAAMFGISILLVGLLDWLSSRQYAKVVVIGVMVALAIHTNLYTAKSYQLSWEKQRSFYWQLFWRAPYIQPGTAFISDGELFSFVGRYSTSMGISMLYPTVTDPQDMPYWFFNYWENIFRYHDELLTGFPLKEGLRNYTFDGNSRNSLVFSFSPETNRCLEIYSERDVNVKEIPSALKDLASISDVKRIEQIPAFPDWSPPESIFGPEPKHQWCYFFQKAELASQYQDWGEVIHLLRSAQQNGFSPGDRREYLVFIDAYIQAGDFDQALKLTITAKGETPRNNDNLCGLWHRDVPSESQAQFNLIYEQVKQELGCGT